jgi:GT2 family glycosyltransferase
MFLDLVKFASSSNAHIISPKIYFYNSNILWYGGGYILPYQVDIRQKGYMTKDDSQFDLIQETGFAPGCFIYIKGEVFEKIGLMDEKYFVYVEDTDFILRAIKAGFRIVYYPKHHLYHKVGISTGGLLSDFYLYYNTRNRIYFARKHFPLIKKTIAISYVILSMIIKSVFRKDMKLKKLLFRSFRDGFNR